ncbi:MAG: class I SAM-dependent methyltransferase, partial [Opitutaceae bacterium]|nr:class I SAM-dependent methyltransferase [Opitutaceae bacterium]
WLFDTFEGMVEPTAEDVSCHDEAASAVLAADSRVRCVSHLNEVVRSFETVDYPRDLVHFVKGRVEETIPAKSPESIALLRLDTDWYESTRHELVHLFPKLVRGGVLIIDDFGHWKGAKLAATEYFRELDIPVLLNRIDYTGRIAVRI